MSSHSRSSSEIETIRYGEILPVFVRELCNDFEFSDVEQQLKKILNDADFEYIRKEKGKAQILHLLWVLQNKSDRFVLEFLDLINYEYNWIVDKIKHELREYSADTELYLETLKRIHMENQDHTGYNIHRTRLFMKLRTELRKLNPKYGYSAVVLLGELGSGKKWLALDVCSDFGVLQCMDFKIFWIDCINCTSQEDDYNALQTLMIKLNPEYNFDCRITNDFKNQILLLKEQLKRKLEEKSFKNCLLVLKNVLNVKVVEAFNLGCKRLIITRNKRVNESMSTKINKRMILEEGLSVDEFNLLLDKHIAYNWRVFAQPYASDIYHLSNGDPYLLSIIAKKISKKRSNWTEWKKHLENMQIPDKKCKKDVENSLKILKPDYLRIYATMSVFPVCAKFPVKLLAHICNLSLRDAEDIIEKLHENSFVKKEILEDRDTTVCSLKFVYSSYIKNCPVMQQLIDPLELHRQIIQYYKVEESLCMRREVYLFFEDQHDYYFFKSIGYHLYGSQYFSLFPKLYMDMGFLGQKMRTVGLLNTLGDLRDYKKKIIEPDPLRLTRVYEKLIEFLARHEEKIVHSQDCCLLQYALLAEEPINEMALKQIEQFPRRVWFSEKGNFHQRRFIVNLLNTAKIVHSLNEELSIVVLDNNDTYLLDISLESSCGPVHLIEASNVNILETKTFSNDNYLITMDALGRLRIWSINDEKRRSLVQRKDSKKKFNPLNVQLCPSQVCKRSYKQQLDVTSWCSSDDRIVAFYIEHETRFSEEEFILHVALKTGIILVFNWNPKTEQFYKFNGPWQTKIPDISCFCKIKTHYMILNKYMTLSFINLRNTAKEPMNFQWPVLKSSLVAYEPYELVNEQDGSHENYVLFIFNNTILRLKLNLRPESYVVEGKLETFQKFDISSDITCAKLSLKNRYLILGTRQGLQVIDIMTGRELLQTIVSENISCVDVFDLDDEQYQAMVTCGVEKKKILYLFGLRKTEQNTPCWQHTNREVYENITLEQRNARLLGGKLFHVAYESDNSQLYAVDSKNMIHQICTGDNKSWSIMQPPEITGKISALCVYKQLTFVGSDKGEIFNLSEEMILCKAFEAPINFMKLLNDNILIVSLAPSNCGTVNTASKVIPLNNINHSLELPISTIYSELVLDNFLICVNESGGAVFLKVFCNQFIFKPEWFIAACEPLGGCDLKNNNLFLGFRNYLVHIYSLEKTANGDISYQKRCDFSHREKKTIITCVAASVDAGLFAIGLNVAESKDNSNKSDTPYIDVFRLDENYKEHFLYTLKSHVEPIYDMLFSPHNDVLVSISEQVCFWSLSHVQNNPLDIKSTKRHSSRFSSQKSAEHEEVDATTNNCFSLRRQLFLNVQPSLEQSEQKSMVTESFEKLDCLDASSSSESDNVFASDAVSEWHSYQGPSDKLELLACLKFDGREAKQIFANKQFTQFSTIDNEGVYYNLNLIKSSRECSPDSVDTATGAVGVSLSTASSSSNLNIAHSTARLSIASNMSGCDVVDFNNDAFT